MELREAPKVGEIAKKVQDREAELVRAYMMRREDHYQPGKKVVEMEVQLSEAEERKA